MSCGSRRPSPSASTPTTVQVDGMNCIGPTARSKRWSPSSRPASVSPMREVAPWPVSRGPRIAGCTTPSAVIKAPPKRPWLLSTWPIAAISCQVRWQEGSAWRITVSARWYAVRARLGTASTEAAPRASARTPSPAESRRGSSDTDAGASTAPESSGTSGMTGSAAEAAGKASTERPGVLASGRISPAVAITDRGARTATRQSRRRAGPRPRRLLVPVTGLPRSRRVRDSPRRCRTRYLSLPARSPGVCPSFCRYVSARRDTATASLPRTTPDPPSRIRPRPLGV